MPSVCHSVVRASTARVTRLGPCGEISDTGCDFAVTDSFVEITLTKVYQERQDALQLNANGAICVDVPTPPILRWYEVAIQFCGVDPELFNIVSAEPLVMNDATIPEAIGWCTLPDSAASASFALEFWTGTDDDDCDDGQVTYGYGIMPRIIQGTIGDVTITNGVITFTVNGISRGANQWGVGPYNVIVNETGPNAGFPGPMLEAMNPASHKCFFWTHLPPPEAACGCQDLEPAFQVLPLTGLASVVRTATFPTADGEVLLPGVIDWGDASPEQVVTSGTSATHNYVAGTYTATYRTTSQSGPTYTSAVITVT